MKQKIKKKEADKSAFSHLLEKVEKEQKRAKITYSVGISLMAIALISFLIFSPLQVPVFSQIGDRILGREVFEEKEEEEPEEIEEPKVEEEEEEEPEEIEEEEKVVETQRVYIQQQAPTPTPPPPQPEPEPEPLYSCAFNTMEYYIDEYCKNLGNAKYYYDFAREIRANSWTECGVYSNPDYFMDCINRASARADGWSADGDRYMSEAKRFRELLITSCGVSLSEMQEVASICSQ